MKKLLNLYQLQKLVLAFIFLLASTFSFAQDLNILVFHKTNGFRHTEAINESIKMLRSLNGNAWSVDETIDAAAFTNSNLAKYDVIVFSNTSGGGLLNDSQKAAMEAFIQSGKGFVGFHAATDTYRNDSNDARWPWYNELVGAIVQINPYHTANNLPGIMNVLTDNPITSHLGNTWAHNEEWYYWERNGGQLSPNNTVLLEVQSTGNNSYDAKRPVTWLKEFDGGRSFYTALGQNGRTYENNNNFREMVKKAVVWASNKSQTPPPGGNCGSVTSQWTDLLANDLECWEVWMGVPHSTTGLPGSSNNVTNGSGTPLGLNNDPRNVFSVINVNGEKQLYITGEVYGGLTTKNEYGNYHLSMQFKWGTKKWEPRLNQKRDSGILYHCKGEHGSFWDVWKSSLEYQVQEGDCGDYIGLAGAGALIPAKQVGNQHVFTPGATPVSKNFVKRSQNFENPNGQWNTLEVIVVGDRAIHYVNGNMVNAVLDAKWNGNTITSGQIQIQSEAAEIFYRNIRIKAATDFPQKDLTTLGWGSNPDPDPDPNPDCDTNAPVGKTIALQKSGGDQKWVTINGTNSNLIANGNESDRELFLVEQHSTNGCIALKSITNGKYVQVVGSNTDAVIRATGNAPGTWENFAWKQKGNNKVALKSLFNNGWIQANWNLNNASLIPKGTADGQWETFDYVVISDTDPNPDPNTISIDCTSLPSSLNTDTSIQVAVKYSADQNRDVVIELWNSGWLGQGKKTVSAGPGNTIVTINLNNAPAVGSNYLLKASIRPVGASWQQNIKQCSKNNITLSNAGTDPDPNPGSDTSFYIVNRQTGKKLRPLNNNDGVALIQVDAAVSDNFVKWEQVDTDTGFFYLKNVATGKYFRPATDGNGTAIEQRPTSYSGYYTQWEKISTFNEYFYLKNRQTKLYFRPNTDANNSTMVQRPTSYGGNYTQWVFQNTNRNLLANKNNVFDVAIYPNPVLEDQININVASNREQNASILLYDITGKEIFATQLFVGQGNQTISLSVNELNIQNKGVYFIRLKTKTNTKTIKVFYD